MTIQSPINPTTPYDNSLHSIDTPAPCNVAKNQSALQVRCPCVEKGFSAMPVSPHNRVAGDSGVVQGFSTLHSEVRIAQNDIAHFETKVNELTSQMNTSIQNQKVKVSMLADNVLHLGYNCIVMARIRGYDKKEGEGQEHGVRGGRGYVR